MNRRLTLACAPPRRRGSTFRRRTTWLLGWTLLGSEGLAGSCSTPRAVVSTKQESAELAITDAEAREPISEYLEAVGCRNIHRMRAALDVDSPCRRLVGSPRLGKNFDTADFRLTRLERIGEVDEYVVCIFGYEEVRHYGDDAFRDEGWSIAILRRRDFGLRLWRESVIRDWDGPQFDVTPAPRHDSSEPSPASADEEFLKRTFGRRLSAETKGDPDEAERVSCSDAARMPFFCAVGVDGGFAGRMMDSGRVLASFGLVACDREVALCRSNYLRPPSIDGRRRVVDELILFHRHRDDWKIAKEIQLSSRDVE